MNLEQAADYFGDCWLEWDDKEDEARQKERLLNLLQEAWDDGYSRGFSDGFNNEV